MQGFADTMIEDVYKRQEQLRVNKSHRGIVIYANGGTVNITFNGKGDQP